MSVRFETEEKASGYLVKTFHGKRKKATSYFVYRTRDQRTKAIQASIAGDVADIAFKREQAQRRVTAMAAMAERVQVGSIFHYSWGYDQTQCEFFQVVSKSKSGKSVMVRQVGAVTVAGSASFMADRRRADVGSFLEDSKPTKKILTSYGISMRHGGTASLVEDPASDSFHCSWYA